MNARPRKTYWHLANTPRVPSRYEVVTSKLLYYPEKGFSVKTPVGAWYERYVGQSPIPASCYAHFSDPRANTYRQYVRHARDQEIALQAAFDAALALKENDVLNADWVGLLHRVLPIVPFLFHGLQMHAAYCGQLAPEGKLVVAWAFKAGNGMRRVQNVSRRLAALAPELDWAAVGKNAWQSEPAWQPLRELVERLLVAYDLGEAWVASTLVVEPVLDQVLFVELMHAARRANDVLTAQVLQSLGVDAVWHAEWAQKLHACGWGAGSEARRAIEEWTTKWWPLTERAVTSMLELWGLPAADQQALLLRLREQSRYRWSALGMSGVVT